MLKVINWLYRNINYYLCIYIYICVYYVSVCTILIYKNVDTFELVVVYMPKWHQASRFNPRGSKDWDFHLV